MLKGAPDVNVDHARGLCDSLNFGTFEAILTPLAFLA